MPPIIVGCYIPAKLAAHFAKRATPEEVYEVLENAEFLPLWERTKSLGASPAYWVYGRTAAGRYLFIPGIVFSDQPLKNVFMPATARPMSKAERAYYIKQKGGK